MVLRVDAMNQVLRVDAMNLSPDTSYSLESVTALGAVSLELYMNSRLMRGVSMIASNPMYSKSKPDTH